MSKPILSIIIPVFNEERTLEEVFKKIIAVKLCHGFSKELIIINDCSTDGSLRLIEDLQEAYPGELIHIINQESNQGKGAAIRKGVSSSSGAYVIIQDADLEYDPLDYNALLNKAKEDDLDAVYGSRFINQSLVRTLTSWHSMINRLLTLLSNVFSGLSLTDMETCYKLIDGDIFRSLNLEEQRFGIEPEITAKLARIEGVQIAEVPIQYIRRGYHEGKKIGWKDGVRALYCILKYNL